MTVLDAKRRSINGRIQNGVQLKLIEGGSRRRTNTLKASPVVFLRDECLNDHWFTSLAEPLIRIPQLDAATTMSIDLTAL